MRFLCLILRPQDCPQNRKSHSKIVRLERFAHNASSNALVIFFPQGRDPELTMGIVKWVKKSWEFSPGMERLHTCGSLCVKYFSTTVPLGPFPRKMVKLNPGLNEILSTVFLLRACNSNLQNTAELLVWDTVIFVRNVSLEAMHRKVNTKKGTKSFSWISANRPFRNWAPISTSSNWD